MVVAYMHPLTLSSCVGYLVILLCDAVSIIAAIVDYNC
jgi:hypothetical protein